ncbi:uncharacterized protein LOC110918122 [Helianthus annuus]|uniref:uncharacterized protein LOC110918122 n=1 Tax=Helianthus annuus TaxID=4232 RepID=UPI0016531C02|nr:uncharacterized protein LOC110918122 [Helianthus annuus]
MIMKYDRVQGFIKQLQFLQKCLFNLCACGFEGHRFSHLKRTKVRVIIFTNDGLQPYNLEQRSNPHSLTRAFELTGCVWRLSRRLEATWSARRAKQFAIKCQTTRSCTELASFMDGVWNSSRPIWRVFYMRAIRRLKA